MPIVDIHLKVRKLREAAGLSRPALERKAGLPARTLERVENRTQTPRRGALAALASALGVTVAVLEGDAEPPLEAAVSRLVVKHGARAVISAALDVALPEKE